MFPISSPVQSVIYAVVTKSIGSGFRVTDDWNGPTPRLMNTLKRESTLLGLTTLMTTGIQMLFTRILSSTLQSKPGWAQHELLLRALVTAPALIFAEWTSRQLAPKDYPPGQPHLVTPKSFGPFVQVPPIPGQPVPPVIELSAPPANSPAIFYA